MKHLSPTRIIAGLVGGLTYFAANAIKTQYLKDPGPLVRQ